MSNFTLLNLHETHSEIPWRRRAEHGLVILALTDMPFEAYHLTLIGVPEPDHPNRWGPLFSWGRHRGIIELVGYERSSRSSRAGGVTGLWRGTDEFRGRYDGED